MTSIAFSKQIKLLTKAVNGLQLLISDGHRQVWTVEFDIFLARGKEVTEKRRLFNSKTID